MIFVFSAVLLAAALIIGGLYWRKHGTKPLTDKDTIVLADFCQQHRRRGF